MAKRPCPIKQNPETIITVQIQQDKYSTFCANETSHIKVLKNKPFSRPGHQVPKIIC